MVTEGQIAETRQNLGDRIRLVRTNQGLTQDRLALMIGMDRGYLLDVEKGRRNVSVDNLIRISSGLGINLSDLCQGIEDRRPMR